MLFKKDTHIKYMQNYFFYLQTITKFVTTINNI